MLTSHYTAAAREPVPGWIDTLYGPTGERIFISCICFYLLPTSNQCLETLNVVNRLYILLIAMIGYIAGGATGFLRLFKCDESCVIDLCPVDYSVNTMIAVAWHTAIHKYSTIYINLS